MSDGTASTSFTNEKWVPVRPEGFHSLSSRLRLAWLVFTGRADADNVENLVFSMLEYDGELHYSQHRYDYNVIADGVAIDGGRAYDRYTLVDATIKRFVIRDGKFEEKKDG